MAKHLAALLPDKYRRNEVNMDFEKPFSVNPALMDRIRAYDPQLVIYFNKAGLHYVIARKGNDGQLRYIAAWVDEKTKKALPLDARLYQTLVKWDMRPARVGSPTSASDLARRQESEEEALAEKGERAFDEDISHLTRANRRQLQRVFDPIR